MHSRTAKNDIFISKGLKIKPLPHFSWAFALFWLDELAETLLRLLRFCSCFWDFANVSEILQMCLRFCWCFWDFADVSEFLLRFCWVLWRFCWVLLIFVNILLRLLRSNWAFAEISYGSLKFCRVFDEILGMFLWFCWVLWIFCWDYWDLPEFLLRFCGVCWDLDFRQAQFWVYYSR